MEAHDLPHWLPIFCDATPGPVCSAHPLAAVSFLSSPQSGRSADTTSVPHGNMHHWGVGVTLWKWQQRKLLLRRRVPWTGARTGTWRAPHDLPARCEPWS